MNKNKNNKTVLLGIVLGGCLVLGISTRTLALMSADECRNLRSQRENAIARINSQAEAAIEELNQNIESDEFQAQVEERRQQLRGRLNDLLEDQEQLNQAIENDVVPSEVQAVLEEAKDNPNAIDEFLDRQEETLLVRLVAKIRERQVELIERVPVLPNECSSGTR